MDRQKKTLPKPSKIERKLPKLVLRKETLTRGNLERAVGAGRTNTHCRECLPYTC